MDVACVAMVFKCFMCFLSDSDACLKRFTCLRTYAASVVSGCFKSRSDVASLSLPFCYLASVSSPLLDAGDVRAAWGRAAWVEARVVLVRGT